MHGIVRVPFITMLLVYLKASHAGLSGVVKRHRYILSCLSKLIENNGIKYQSNSQSHLPVEIVRKHIHGKALFSTSANVCTNEYFDVEVQLKDPKSNPWYKWSKKHQNQSRKDAWENPLDTIKEMSYNEKALTKGHRNDKVLLIQRRRQKEREYYSKSSERLIYTTRLWEAQTVFDREQMQKEMNKHVDDLKKLMSKHIILRPASGALQQLEVKTSSGTFPLQELATITRKTTYLFYLDMRENPERVTDVFKAIKESSLLLEPVLDKQNKSSIHVPIPKVTKDRRETLCDMAQELYDMKVQDVSDIYDKSIKKIAEKKFRSDVLIEEVVKQMTVQYELMIMEMDAVCRLLQDELLSDPGLRPPLALPLIKRVARGPRVEDTKKAGVNRQ